MTEYIKKAIGPNARLTRDDWIKAATRSLEEKSIDGVRIEVLAKELAITKGSFYSYFQNREELLRAVITSWERKATLAVIDRLEESDQTAEERLRTLYRLSTAQMPGIPGGPLELAIRAWSRRDESVREAVRTVDEARRRYISMQFQQMGCTELEASAHSLLYYTYVAGRNIFRQHGEKVDDQAYDLVEELILRVGSVTRQPVNKPVKNTARKAARKTTIGKPLADT